MNDIIVRSLFDPNVRFPLRDERAFEELRKYGCVIISGAVSLANTASVCTILQQTLAGIGITETSDIPMDYDLQCIKQEFFLNEVNT